MRIVAVALVVAAVSVCALAAKPLAVRYHEGRLDSREPAVVTRAVEFLLDHADRRSHDRIAERAGNPLICFAVDKAILRRSGRAGIMIAPLLGAAVVPRQAFVDPIDMLDEISQLAAMASGRTFGMPADPWAGLPGRRLYNLAQALVAAKLVASDDPVLARIPPPDPRVLGIRGGETIDAVLAGSAAERLGVRAGDRIVQLGDSGMGDVDFVEQLYQAHILARRFPPILIERAGQRISIQPRAEDFVEAPR
jgi:hypothetical protein